MTKDNLIRLIQEMSPTKAELVVEKFRQGKIARNDYLLKVGAVPGTLPISSKRRRA